MSVAVALFDAWLRVALGSFVVLAVASVAMLAIRQPARRIRVIQWALGGLVALPLLVALPGYPRLAILPRLAELSNVEQHDNVEHDAVQGTEVPALRSSDARLPSLPAEPFLEMPVGPAEFESAASAPEQSAIAWGVDEAPIDGQAVEPRPPAPIDPHDVGAVPGPIESHMTIEPLAAEAPATIPNAIESESPWLPRDYRAWLLAAYGTGVLAMAAWSCLGLLAVWRLMRGVRDAPLECRVLLRSLGGPPSERVALVVSHRVQQPCALLWRRTTIVLPESLVAAADPQVLRWALAHEWSHVERGDLVAWNASGLLRWFYFYQPLLWWLRGQLQLCQDYVADAAAARFGDMPEDYAEFLTTSSLTRPTLAAGLGIGGRISDLRRRVIMLVERRRPLESKSPRAWNFVGLPLAVALVAMVAAMAPVGRLEADNRLEAGGGRLEEEVQGGGTGRRDEAPAPEEAVTPAEAAEAAESTAPSAVADTHASQDSQPELPIAIPEALVEQELKKDPVIAQLSNAIDNYEAYLARLLKVTANPAESKQVQQVQEMIAHVRAEMDMRMAQERPRVVEALAHAQSRREDTSSTQNAKAAPQAPRRIRPGDVLRIDVQDNFDSLNTPGLQLLMRSGTELPVDEEGRVSLGSAYGRMELAGKTLEESEYRISDALLQLIWQRLLVSASDPKAAKASLEQLRKQMQINVRLSFVNPQTTVAPGVPSQTFLPAKPAATPISITPAQVSRPHSQPPAPPVSTFNTRIHSGDRVSVEARFDPVGGSRRFLVQSYTVDPDGLIAMGAEYGRCKLAGLTVEEAEQALIEKLSEYGPGVKVQITHYADASNRPRVQQYPAISAGIPTVDTYIRALQRDQSSRTVPHERIQPGDVLHIEAEPPEAQLNRDSLVEADGGLALGARYGRVHVLGKTLSEAEEMVKAVVAKVYRDPEVQVTFAQSTAFGSNTSLADTTSVEELQREISKLKATIRMLESAKASPIRSQSYGGYAAPGSDLPPSSTPPHQNEYFGPDGKGPVGPLQFDTPPSDKPRPPADKPKGKLSQDSN